MSYDYEAFGALKSSSGSLANAFRFAGEQSDAETGLYCLRARYYDPSTGRFISKDPFPGRIAQPQSLNGFVYVRNNPIVLIDPSGLTWEENWGLFWDWVCQNGEGTYSSFEAFVESMYNASNGT